MKKKYFYSLICLFLLFTISCKEKKKRMVDLDQINFDGSNNDKYLFKDIIKKEKFDKVRYKKEKF